MPDPSRPAADRLPGRRAVIRAGVTAGTAVLVAGCGVRVGSPGVRVAPPAPGPDELARERVARDADALLDLATRGARLRPADRAVLATVAADHREHAAALRPPAGSTPSATHRGTAAVPPITAANALAALARAERTAAAAATAELERVSGEAARLLASVAASRSLHVAVLTARLTAGARTGR